MTDRSNSAARVFRARAKITGVQPQVLAVKVGTRWMAPTIYGQFDLGSAGYIYVFVDTLGNPQSMAASAFEALFEPVGE